MRSEITVEICKVESNRVVEEEGGGWYVEALVAKVGSRRWLHRAPVQVGGEEEAIYLTVYKRRRVTVIIFKVHLESVKY